MTESDLLDKIKKNKVSKALFLIQKSLLLYDGSKANESSVTRSLLEVVFKNIFDATHKTYVKDILQKLQCILGLYRNVT